MYITQSEKTTYYHSHKKLKNIPQNTFHPPALHHSLEEFPDVDTRGVRVSRHRRGDLGVLSAGSGADNAGEPSEGDGDQLEIKLARVSVKDVRGDAIESKRFRAKRQVQSGALASM